MSQDLTDAERNLLQTALNSQLSEIDDLVRRYDAALPDIDRQADLVASNGGSRHAYIVEELSKWAQLIRMRLKMLGGTAAMLGTEAGQSARARLATMDSLIEEVRSRGMKFEAREAQLDHEMIMDKLEAEKELSRNIKDIWDRRW
jgi:hypothetical protein